MSDERNTHLCVSSEHFDPLGGNKQIHLRHRLGLIVRSLKETAFSTIPILDHLPLLCYIRERLFKETYLNPIHGLLSLGHAGVGGRVPLRFDLGGAQVLGTKYHTFQQVIWVTRTRH